MHVIVKMATSYSEYFPRLTGSYGVGVFDVLPSLNGEEPLLIRLYYPTEKKTNDVPKSQLAKWMPKRYTKSYLTNGANIPSAFSVLLSPVVSLMTSELC